MNIGAGRNRVAQVAGTGPGPDDDPAAVDVLRVHPVYGHLSWLAVAGVSEARIDTFVRRLLREKFVLGLFDRPYLDVDHAVATIGPADFVAEGEAAQRAVIVRLTAPDSGPAVLPLTGDQAVYVETAQAKTECAVSSSPSCQ